MIDRGEIMNHSEIVDIIAQSSKNLFTVEIYYPETDNSPEGWREIEAYSFKPDLDDSDDFLVYKRDEISPGHILSAYTLASRNKSRSSFILGKIKKARRTKRKFQPRNDWQINF